MPQYQMRVDVEPAYLADQSDPQAGVFVFSYTITIVNTGEVTAQVISRTWHINVSVGTHERV